MTFSGVLLAGGESRRMGRDKATIIFEGRPLWERQIQILRELRVAQVFVSAREKPAWLPLETEFIADEPPFRGPLSGLTKTLISIRTTHLIVLAVDMPFMTTEQMRRLSELANPGCGVLPMIGERAEPLAAIYPCEAVPHLIAASAGDDFSLQRLSRILVQQGKLQTLQGGPDEVELYRSVNEPRDLIFD